MFGWSSLWLYNLYTMAYHGYIPIFGGYILSNMRLSERRAVGSPSPNLWAVVQFGHWNHMAMEKHFFQMIFP